MNRNKYKMSIQEDISEHYEVLPEFDLLFINLLMKFWLVTVILKYQNFATF